MTSEPLPFNYLFVKIKRAVINTYKYLSNHTPTPNI